jgi:uncharacterized membrane protein YfcA
MMFSVVIGLILIVFGIAALFRRRQPAQPSQGPQAVIGALAQSPLLGIILTLVGIGFLASTSFVLVSANKVGHLKRVYLAGGQKQP